MSATLGASRSFPFRYRRFRNDRLDRVTIVLCWHDLRLERPRRERARGSAGFDESQHIAIAVKIRRCWPAATRSMNVPAPRAQTDGQAKPAIGAPSALSGLTRSGPKRSAKAMGPPTRSPGKQAAAAPWPGRPNTQLENHCTGQLR
jgi:hypothetical protein